MPSGSFCKKTSAESAVSFSLPRNYPRHLRETGHSLFPLGTSRATNETGTKRFECLAWLAVANQLTTPGPVKHYSYCSRDFSGRLGPPCTRRLQSTNEYRGESAARERSACNTRTPCMHTCVYTQTRDSQPRRSCRACTECGSMCA